MINFINFVATIMEMIKIKKKKIYTYVHWGICLGTFPIRQIPKFLESVLWGICVVFIIIIYIILRVDHSICLSLYICHISLEMLHLQNWIYRERNMSHNWFAVSKAYFIQMFLLCFCFIFMTNIFFLKITFL